MSGASVREASARDVPAILEMLYELGRPRPHNGGEAAEFGRLVEGYIADGKMRVLVAVAGGEIVGVVSAMLLARLNRTSQELYVPELIVRSGHRRRGIGRALAERCIEIASESGCHRIRLESGNLRTGSHRFYRELGFEQSALSFDMDLDIP